MNSDDQKNPESDLNPKQQGSSPKGATILDMSSSDIKRLWLHPITWVSFVILGSLILFIAANVLGFDKGGTLGRLAQPEYARGLITYLFTVGTIGVIVAVTLTILLSTEETEEKIKRAKDVLTVLIGILGTIIGFYFGSEIRQEPQPVIEIAAPLTNNAYVVGEPFELSTVVTGGIPPYEYWIYAESQTFQGTTSDLIRESLLLTPTFESLTITILVKDRGGNSGFETKTVPVDKS